MTLMDRRAWLAERRKAVEATYDDEGPTYDRGDSIAPMHARFVSRLLEMVPPGSAVLDAPCGAGKYFAMVRGAGRRVVGVDQSAGMLGSARAKGIADRLEQVGLQEMAFDQEFDGVMTVDAMENVPPEDWPRVAANLHRALRPGGHLYLTVEEIGQSEIDEAFAELSKRGLPAVPGELIEGDVAGYHYYPGREQVVAWLDQAGLELVEEDYRQEAEGEGGWGYRHLLLRSRPA